MGREKGDGFARLRWGETKEGDTVGGARLTIEIGADFPIGINVSRFLGESTVFPPSPLWKLSY